MHVQRSNATNLIRYAHHDYYEHEYYRQIMQAQKLLKRVEERVLYSCTANIRVPEIELASESESDMDGPESKRIRLDSDVYLNLEIIEKLRDEDEKEKFLQDVWSKFSGENHDQSELSHAKEKLWLEVRITIRCVYCNTHNKNIY